MRIEAPTVGEDATPAAGRRARSAASGISPQRGPRAVDAANAPRRLSEDSPLAQGAGPLTTDQQAKVLEEARPHSAEHLSLIIDNLVDLADLEAGQTELRIGYVQVGALLKAAMEEARVAGRSKRLTVECLGCGDLNPSKVTRQRSTRRFANLLDNAVRFSPHGGVILGELHDAGDRYEVSIYDQGSGMDVAHLDRLSRPVLRIAAYAYLARAPGGGSRAARGPPHRRGPRW